MTESTPTPHNDERDADRDERDADRDERDADRDERDADRDERPASVADALTLTADGLRYALDRPPRRGGGKVVVSVGLESGADTPLRDRVDLYGFKERMRFAGLVADLFARERRATIGHLAVLLDGVERAREAERGREAASPREALSETRRAKALCLLARPDLLDRAAGAMTALGYVGEEAAKRLSYLVATSRLLARPLSAIVLAPSGSGKSELLDVTAQLLPAGAVEFLSRISPAALYYAGPDALRHKLVVVDERSGSADADYAVRTLQSKGLLRLALPVKGKTEHFEATGPIALMSGTTSPAINAENLSRCLRLTLDDSPEQTRRIQEAQRRAWAGKKERSVDVARWQDAQLLLNPAGVAIPFAERLTFPTGSTHDRRGNQKLLGLVAAHTLLCQRQRERDERGRLLATVADYAVVHALLAPALAEDLDGLSPRAARVYRLLGECGTPSLSRRELKERLGCCFNTADRAVKELLSQELVTLADAGPPARYRLLDRSVLGSKGALLDPSELTAA